MVIELGDSDSEDDDSDWEHTLLDDDDRHLIDRELAQGTRQQAASLVCDLSQTFHQDFINSVLPLQYD